MFNVERRQTRERLKKVITSDLKKKAKTYLKTETLERHSKEIVQPMPRWKLNVKKTKTMIILMS